MIKFPERKMKDVMDLYMSNEHWREIFEGAPSEACKDYFRLSFYDSTYDMSNEKFVEIRDKIYAQLSIDDWKYLKKTHPGTPFTKKCAEKIAELSK